MSPSAWHKSSYLVTHSSSDCWNTVVSLMADLKVKGKWDVWIERKRMSYVKYFLLQTGQSLFCVAIIAHYWAPKYY